MRQGKAQRRRGLGVKGVVGGEGRKKRVRWRLGDVVMRVWKVGEMSCAVVRRVRGSRWRRMDSRSSGVVRTLATEGGWGGVGGLGVVGLVRLRRARARGSGLCVILAALFCSMMVVMWTWSLERHWDPYVIRRFDTRVMSATKPTLCRIRNWKRETKDCKLDGLAQDG